MRGTALFGTFTTLSGIFFISALLAAADEFVVIPPGNFLMGNTFSEGRADELPAHWVTVGAYHVAKNEVTGQLWEDVRTWAVSHGYPNLTGQAKDPTHPVSGIRWSEALIWCNARSERDGMTPCYRTSSISGAVYKNSTLEPVCDWSANGYRLPTEAEWEKAARGGLAGKRFPWGDIISQNDSNYFVSTSNSVTPLYSYDAGPLTPSNPGNSYHPLYKTTWPYTSPVGSFPPNGYGLHDVVGNVWEWCWDRHEPAYYTSSPLNDPRGPEWTESTNNRIRRGGEFANNAFAGRLAARNPFTWYSTSEFTGFRLARNYLGPSVLCSVPTAITSDRARLHGVVHPNGLSTAASFEYGLTKAYGSEAALVLAPAYGGTAQMVHVDLTGLEPGSLYHYRLTAKSSGGTMSTADGTFKTFPTRTTALAWGLNSGGQLGNGGTTQSATPTPVGAAGALAGKTVVAMAAGAQHSLALCSDGTVAAWGQNSSGQLGNGTTALSRLPVVVSMAGILAGRRVIAIAAGQAHSMALCADGTVAAWGQNSSGQLGDNSTNSSSVPVAVTGGALAGKKVLAIGCGGFHSVALCADGTVAAWGLGSLGRLGHNSTENSLVPVSVHTGGFLSGKLITAIAVGYQSTLALCADGTVAGWGENGGRLGDGSTAASTVPVPVVTTGALAGKVVERIALGSGHALALCSDGTLVSWGSNIRGQMGVGSGVASSLTPLAVLGLGTAPGERLVGIATGQLHSHALCADGTVLAWGSDQYGQLGEGGSTDVFVPVGFKVNAPGTGQRFAALGGGMFSSHSLGIVGMVESPIVFIPGIGGSVLKKPNGDQLWPATVRTDYIRELNLRANPNLEVRAVDVVRDISALGVPAMKIYGPLFAQHFVGRRGYVEFDLREDPARLTSTAMLTEALADPQAVKPRLFPFPYDWRHSNATQTDTLHQYLQRISELHDGAKVTLVAHSMGSLLARRYMLEHGTEKVDKFVTIGAPFWGAPVAIYRMLTGNFFEPITPLDTINRRAMWETLVTLPGALELLPSSLYFHQSSSAIFSEDNWDFDGLSGTGYTYSMEHFWSVFDQKAQRIQQETSSPTPPLVPSATSAAFHTPRMDNSSNDAGLSLPITIPTLHIFGQQDTDKTPLGVVAKARTFWERLGGLPNPLVLRSKFIFEKVYGPGDETVPTLSAERPAAFRHPGAVTKKITGGDEATHNGMMTNPAVWDVIDDFMEDGELVQSPTSMSAPGGRKRILLLGTGYVKVRDAAGNENTRLGDLVILKIPGVDIEYGGDEGWVIIECDADKQLTLDAAWASNSVELEVTGLKSDATPQSLRRFRFEPQAAAWRLDAATAESASLRVDQDGNSTLEPGEDVPPTHISTGGVVDVAQPKVSLTLAVQEEAVTATVTGMDAAPSGPPALYYSIDDGGVQPYSAALPFPRAAASRLKVFAEDAAGNTSALIETHVNPAVSISAETAQTMVLSWPVAEAYSLEESTSLNGVWTPAMAPVTRRGQVESVSIPLSGETHRFFRLRSSTITR